MLTFIMWARKQELLVIVTLDVKDNVLADRNSLFTTNHKFFYPTGNFGAVPVFVVCLEHT